MDTTELVSVLNAALRGTSIKSWGVLAADEVKPSLFTKDKLPAAFVINIESSDKPGLHWCALYVSKDDSIFFDSFGQSPAYYKFGFSVNRFNTRVLQNPRTRVCGMYAVLFLISVLVGCTVHSFVTQFKNNTLYNDKLVYKEFIKLRKCPKPKQCKHNQTCQQRCIQ
jgi:hypothetical protein